MKGGTVPARGRLPGGLAALFVVLLVGVGCSIVIDGPRWGWGNPTSWVTGERSFSFSAAEVDRVRCTTHNGSIVASTTSPAGPPAQIDVRAAIKAGGRSPEDAQQAFAAVHLDVRVEDGVLRAGWRWLRPQPRSRRASVSFTIRQPRETPLVATSHNGRIEAAGLAAGCHAETHNGRIEMTECGGECVAITHNGRLRLRDCSGAWRLVTHNGSVRVSGDPRALRVKTHNGGIRAAIFSAGEIGGEIESYNGRVELGLGAGASAVVRCATHNGGISAEDPFVTVEKGRRHRTARVGRGEGRLSIETHNGHIRLEAAERAEL